MGNGLIRIRMFASFIPLLLVCGCATPGASLRLSAPRTGVQYSQNFAQAYISEDKNGDLQVVLIDEPLPADPKAGQPALQPASAPPLQQVVYFHLFWRPLSGTKADHPSAANASLDWYITPAGSDRGADLLHYQGAAYVTVYGSGENPTLQVRNATFKTVEIRGRMTDPIGQANLQGSITARNDPARVNQILADMRSLQTLPPDARADTANARLGPHPNPPAP